MPKWKVSAVAAAGMLVSGVASGLAPFVSAVAEPLNYDESLLGDISTEFADPSECGNVSRFCWTSGPVFELAVGANVVTGSTLNRVVTYLPNDIFNSTLEFDPTTSSLKCQSAPS